MNTNYLSYSEVRTTLTNKLNLLNNENSGFWPRLTSFVYTTQNAETAKKIASFVRALPQTRSPVCGDIFNDVYPYLECLNIQNLSFSQLLISLDSIDHSLLSPNQKLLLKKFENLEESKKDKILSEFQSEYFQTKFLGEPKVFEAFIQKIPEEIFPDLIESATPVLKKIIENLGFSDIQENDLPTILQQVQTKKSLIFSLKAHLPRNAILKINHNPIHVNKQALQRSCGRFKEIFTDFPDQEKFAIIDDDAESLEFIIKYLMGDTVVLGGHDCLKRMFDVASRYEVKELVQLYDYRLTRCFDCFSKKERAQILSENPSLKIFKTAMEAQNECIPYQ